MGALLDAVDNFRTTFETGEAQESSNEVVFPRDWATETLCVRSLQFWKRPGSLTHTTQTRHSRRATHCDWPIPTHRSGLATTHDSRLTTHDSRLTTHDSGRTSQGITAHRLELKVHTPRDSETTRLTNSHSERISHAFRSLIPGQWGRIVDRQTA